MANLGVVDRNELIQMFAKSVGQQKAEEVICDTARKLNITNNIYTTQQVSQLLEDLSKQTGTISIVARFIKTRFAKPQTLQ
ncbi:MAG: hypothetical protein HYS39_03190 [Proteobacteria bacterium]|nr:hypothetical protein [Pseudomonadota bacterium]